MLVDADSDAYAAATRPHNSSVAQRPARVAVVSGPDDIAATLDEVAALATSSGTPLEVVPQATGHGAGAPVAEGAVLLDTSRLTGVSIDAVSRVAVVGAAPVSDSWGPTDAAGLARIHLDPPTATPAIGDARWLDASAPEIAGALLATAVPDDAGLVMMEIRHVAGAPVRRPGAVVSPPGGFLHHAVGVTDRFSRERIDAAFARARSVWSSADAGSTPGSWVEGAARVPDALPADVRARAASIADAVDPGARIRRSRLLG